jgi:hypothetical protein
VLAQQGYAQGYPVDGAALIRLPRAVGTGEIHRPFLNDLTDFLLDPRRCIAGANRGLFDADAFLAEHRRAAHERTDLRTLLAHDIGDLLARKDGDQYTLISRSRGRPFVMSFTDAPAVEKASPDLVDLQLTHECDRMCRCCCNYSIDELDDNMENERTQRKLLAKVRKVEKIAKALKKLEVLDVCLCGGDSWSFIDEEACVVKNNIAWHTYDHLCRLVDMLDPIRVHAAFHLEHALRTTMKTKVDSAGRLAEISVSIDLNGITGRRNGIPSAGNLANSDPSPTGTGCRFTSFRSFARQGNGTSSWTSSTTCMASTRRTRHRDAMGTGTGWSASASRGGAGPPA